VSSILSAFWEEAQEPSQTRPAYFGSFGVLMGDWNENSRRAKIERTIDPREGRSLKPRKGEKPAGRKTLLDRLAAARVSLLQAIEWDEDDKRRGERPWWGGYKRSREKQYDLALQACQDAGIDVKA
jgi:hypothetical protein